MMTVSNAVDHDYGTLGHAGSAAHDNYDGDNDDDVYLYRFEQEIKTGFWGLNLELIIRIWFLLCLVQKKKSNISRNS